MVFSFKNISLFLIIHFFFLIESGEREQRKEWEAWHGGQRERWQVERLCQGWLLFNKLLLRGWWVPDFWLSPAPFCGIVKFMMRASELISPPLASSSASLPPLFSWRERRSWLWLVWQQLLLTSLWVFQSAVEQFCTRRTSFWQIQQLPSHIRLTPWVFEPFYGTHCKNISTGSDGDDSRQPARYTWVKLHSDYPLITNIINLKKN